jgi:two-component system cell cycle response regulator DivK
MKRRILLVEDNENNRYLAKFLLERDGFEVIVAVNGLECLDAVRKEKPELIVMDIQMPELDGYETAQRLRSDPACASIPIVGVSSFAMPADREKAMNAGFAGYIEKPINPLTFAQQIAGFLKQDPKS